MWQAAIEMAKRCGGDRGSLGLMGPDSLPAAIKPNRLIVLETEGWPDVDPVTKAAFGQRRKMVRQSLKPLGVPVEELLSAAGLKGDERAEELPILAFLDMAKAVGMRRTAAKVNQSGAASP